jgi:hypothetical protein
MARSSETGSSYDNVSSCGAVQILTLEDAARYCDLIRELTASIAELVAYVNAEIL